MKSTTITYIFLAFIAILGYNAFLIKRDAEMFKVYYPEQSIQEKSK
jgi:hypothetical protein